VLWKLVAIVPLRFSSMTMSFDRLCPVAMGDQHASGRIDDHQVIDADCARPGARRRGSTLLRE